MNQNLYKAMRKSLPSLRDVVGIDVGMAFVKAVRIRADGSGRRTVIAAGVLPRIDLLGDSAPASGALSLPKRLAALSGALSYSSRRANLKLVTPPQSQQFKEAEAPDLLGLPASGGFRVRTLHLGEGSLSSVLVTAVPEEEVRRLSSLLPATRPVPVSAALSGLASVSAYLHANGGDLAEGCDLVIDAGYGMTTMAVFQKGLPFVLRQFPGGVQELDHAIANELSCPVETAHDILISGEVNIQGPIRSAFGSFLRQIGIAVDFTERRAGARLQRVLLMGGLANNPQFRSEVRASIGVEPALLNPWQSMLMLPDALSSEDAVTGCCFAAATGAALSFLEDL
jgi:Tfp pilus assembly PilM family ATPase